MCRDDGIGVTPAAVWCSLDGYWFGGVGLVSGTTDQLGRTRVGAWVVHGLQGVHGVYGMVPGIGGLAECTENWPRHLL